MNAAMAMRPTGSVSDCVEAGTHERLKNNARAWHAGVIEIGAMDDGDGGALVMGNCKCCCSTICRPVIVPVEDAPELCECGRAVRACECAQLFVALSS